MGLTVKAAVLIKQDSSRNIEVRATLHRKSTSGPLNALLFLFNATEE